MLHHTVRNIPSGCAGKRYGRSTMNKLLHLAATDRLRQHTVCGVGIGEKRIYATDDSGTGNDICIGLTTQLAREHDSGII